jgi:hypothetical protein
MELEEKTILVTGDAAARLRTNVEFEIEDDGTELEIELIW